MISGTSAGWNDATIVPGDVAQAFDRAIALTGDAVEAEAPARGAPPTVA